MTTQTQTATPAKLRDGSWGARAPATVKAGDVVTITTKSGKSWDARVTRVVWSGEGVALCATASLDRPAAAPRVNGYGRRTGCSCGSIEGRPRASDCFTCQHDEE